MCELKKNVSFHTLTADVLIGSVNAVLGSVTEELLLDAVPVAAGQLARLAQRLVSEQLRLHLLGLNATHHYIVLFYN